MEKTIDLHKQLRKFLGKDVIINLRNNEEREGKIETIDNYMNVILTKDDSIESIKGEKISYIAIKEN